MCSKALTTPEKVVMGADRVLAYASCAYRPQRGRPGPGCTKGMLGKGRSWQLIPTQLAAEKQRDCDGEGGYSRERLAGGDITMIFPA